MEPNFNTPQFNPEQNPSLPPVHPEYTPGVSPEAAPEQLPQISPERQPRGHEAAPAQGAPVLPPVVPSVPAPTADDTATALSDDDDQTPTVAADTHLIEKEWVDKAKKIIEATKDDPHKREAAVSELQRDYLKKRYGKEIGAA